MKRAIFILLAVLSLSINAQDDNEIFELAKPGEGKCIVYIARRSSNAVLVKFKIYDGDIFLGKLAHNKYFAYECNPGEHVFAAKSENTDYIEANLEEGKTYFIDAEVKMGMMQARVELTSFNKTHNKYEKEKKKFFDFLMKKKGELLIMDNESADTDKKPSDQMRKYQEMKEKGKKIDQITPDLYID